MARQLFLVLIWLICSQSSKQHTTAKSDSPEAPLNATLKTRFINETLPKKCKEQGFCEESINYPEEQIQNLVQELKKSNIVLDNDLNDTLVIENRINFGIEDNPCPSDTLKIVPLIVKDFVDGNWYYVLNSRVNPIQVYKVQICKHAHIPGASRTECGRIILNDDYRAACIQKFIIRAIVVMKNNEPISVTTKIPSCCTCVAIDNY